MRRAVSSLIAATALAGGLAVAAPATVSAQECEGMGCAHANYERTRNLPAYGSRYDGYWDRPGEHRRRGYGHGYYDRYRHYGSGYHYYPGYGYYPGSGDRYDDHRRRDRHDRRGDYDPHDGRYDDDRGAYESRPHYRR